MRFPIVGPGAILALEIWSGSLFGATGSCPLSSEHRRWLDQEVPYIIADQERDEFTSLCGDSEREAFIKRFWAIRDPDRSTEENEYQVEHYRRIQYANQTFHEGRPGWKSERGRAYIRHGPPDDVRYIFGGDRLGVDIRKPTLVLTGGTGDSGAFFRVELQRPESEVWIYRHLPVAKNFPTYFEIIFSRLDPHELYAVHQTLRSIGDGPNLSYDARIQRDSVIMRYKTGEHVGGEFRVVYAGAYKFDHIDDFFQSIFHPSRSPSFDSGDLLLGIQDLERSPGEVLQERVRRSARLREEVQTRISFQPFELSLCFGAIRADSGGTMLPLTLGIEPPRTGDELEVLAELVRPDGSLAATVLDSFPIGRRAPEGEESFLYQTSLKARPGEYRLRVYGMLLKSNRSAYLERVVELPDFSRGEVAMSDVLLFDRVLPRRAKRDSGSDRFLGGSRPLLLKDHVLVPSSDARFRRRDKLTAFFEVYNPGLPPGGKEPNLNLKCNLWKDGALVASLPEKSLDYTTDSKVAATGDRRTTYGLSIPLASLYPGEYAVEFEIYDAVSEKNLVKRTPFRID